MTGPEREQILERLAAGGDFRFEAGRRIRFERRGALFSVLPAAPSPRPPVYHLPIDTSAGSEIAS